jgi:hypothetical protein
MVGRLATSTLGLLRPIVGGSLPLAELAVHRQGKRKKEKLWQRTKVSVNEKRKEEKKGNRPGAQIHMWMEEDQAHKASKSPDHQGKKKKEKKPKKNENKTHGKEQK